VSDLYTLGGWQGSCLARRIVLEQHHVHPKRRQTMTTNIKLRLIGLFTTIALFALPAAEAFAGRNWA
jgi:hypothetical protein